MRVTVLGGNGFIGSHVVDALLTAGHSVCVFGRSAGLRPPPAATETLIGDLSDPDALARALRGSDAVIHAISTVQPASAERDACADVEGNLLGTLRLLQLMQRAGIGRLVYLSSGGAVYGPPQVVPTPETHPLNPIGSYGIVKSAIERYVAVAAGQGLRASVIRPANAYGPRQPDIAGAGFIGTALRRMMRDEPVRIFGDGSIVRDYLHVRDLAELCARALVAEAGLTLNAGSGQGHSLLEVVAKLEQVTGRSARLDFVAGRGVDVPVSVLDCSLARARLGWAPRIPLDAGLAETWDWLRAQGQARSAAKHA